MRHIGANSCCFFTGCRCISDISADWPAGILNNDATQAYLIVPYSGFATIGQQVGVQAQATGTGTINIIATSYALPGTPQDLIFLLVIGV